MLAPAQSIETVPCLHVSTFRAMGKNPIGDRMLRRGNPFGVQRFVKKIDTDQRLGAPISISSNERWQGRARSH